MGVEHISTILERVMAGIKKPEGRNGGSAMRIMTDNESKRLTKALERLGIVDFLIFGVRETQEGPEGFFSRNNGDITALVSSIFTALRNSEELREMFGGLCEILAKEKLAVMSATSSEALN
jgi:hypothetical protein